MTNYIAYKVTLKDGTSKVFASEDEALAYGKAGGFKSIVEVKSEPYAELRHHAQAFRKAKQNLLAETVALIHEHPEDTELIVKASMQGPVAISQKADSSGKGFPLEVHETLEAIKMRHPDPRTLKTKVLRKSRTSKKNES